MSGVISKIKNNSGTIDADVIDADTADIRNGMANSIFASAGMHVRATDSMIDAMVDAIGNCVAPCSSSRTALVPYKTVTGSYLIADGRIKEYPTAVRMYYNVKPGKAYYIIGIHNSEVSAALFLDSNENVLWASEPNTIAGQYNYNRIVVAPDGAESLVMHYFTNAVTAAAYKPVAFEIDTSAVVSDCVFEDVTPEFYPGFYSITGGIELNHDNNENRYLSCDMEVFPGETYLISTSHHYGTIAYSITDLSNRDQIQHYPTKYVESTKSLGFYDVIKIPPRGRHLYVSGVNNKNKNTETYTEDVPIKIYRAVPNIGHRKTLYGKKWVAIGDSLTDPASFGGEYNYVEYVAHDLGLKAVNMGTGGMGFLNGGSGNTESANTFHRKAQNVPVDADLVTVFGSFNDLWWNDKTPIGDADDTGTDTVCGCVYNTIMNLWARVPNALILFILPTPWKSTNPASTRATLAQNYIDAVKSVCARYSVPILDLYRESGLQVMNESFVSRMFLNGDGTHPSSLAHFKYIAPKIKAKIMSLV